MHTIILALLTACSPAPPVDHQGGQSGSLREELPLPEDIDQIDIEAAATQAVRVALAADLQSAWRAHLAVMAAGDGTCPNLFLGAPEDAQIDMDEDVVSWAGTCSDGGVDFGGFLTWQNEVGDDGTSANRSLTGDALVEDGDGVQLQFDGEAEDAATWSPGGGWSYDSSVEGQVAGLGVYGADSEIPGGWRGDSTVSYDDQGRLTVDANLYFFGEPLLDRFDAIVVDVEFPDDCGEEPQGHVGLRGTDGYWFDVYFLPPFDVNEPESALSNAYPYELIDDASCDGCGTLFVRNVYIEGAAPVCPDFDGVRAGLAPPVVDEYVLTLHQLPWETE